MARRPDPLSRSTRRSADRPAIRGRQPSDRLVLLAESGGLTKSNTRKNTRGRQAADAVLYRARRRRHPEETARAALGHRAPDDRVATWSVVYVDGPGGPMVLHDAEVARRDARRVARHLSAVALLAGAETSEQYRHAAARLRRVRTWAPLVVLGPPEIAGTYPFTSDPAALVQLADQVRAGDEDVVVSYGRSRRSRPKPPSPSSSPRRPRPRGRG